MTPWEDGIRRNSYLDLHLVSQCKEAAPIHAVARDSQPFSCCFTYLEVLLLDECVHLLTLGPLLPVTSIIRVDHPTNNNKVHKTAQAITLGIPATR